MLLRYVPFSQLPNSLGFGSLLYFPLRIFSSPQTFEYPQIYPYFPKCDNLHWLYFFISQFLLISFPPFLNPFVLPSEISLPSPTPPNLQKYISLPQLPRPSLRNILPPSPPPSNLLRKCPSLPQTPTPLKFAPPPTLHLAI